MAKLCASEKKREQYPTSLLNRRIDAGGYASMQTYRGIADWPFPTRQQSGWPGFHFAVLDDVWAIQMLASH